MHDGPAQSAESVCVEVMRRMIVLTIPEDEVAVLVARRVVRALPPAALPGARLHVSSSSARHGALLCTRVGQRMSLQQVDNTLNARPSSAGSDPASDSMSRCGLGSGVLEIALFAR